MQDSSAFQFLAIDTIHESTTNPRRTFDEGKLKELAESIKHNGLIQPITVRPNNEGFEIVAGARRFRAAQIGELFSIPARIVEIDDAQALEWQLVENSQRVDVHPYEEAQGFQRLLDIPGYDVAALVEKSGKSASHIYARLSLLQLIPTVAEAFTHERITASHANLIARLPQDVQANAYEQCWRKDWQDKEPHLLPAKHLAAWIQANLYGDESSPRGTFINRDALDVTGHPLIDILFPGQMPTYVPEMFSLYVLRLDKHEGKSIRVPGYSVSEISLLLHFLPFQLSPDGHQLVTTTPVARIPASWKSYDPPPRFEHRRLDPDDPSLTDPDNVLRPRQYSLVDLSSGRITPLIDAPNAQNLGYYSAKNRAAWSADSSRVLLTNVFLPLSNDGKDISRRQKAPCAVASVDLPSFAFRCLFFEADGTSPAVGYVDDVSFAGSRDVVEVFVKHGLADRTAMEYRFQNGVWTLDEQKPSSDIQRSAGTMPLGPTKVRSGIRVFIKQGLNEPPTLWAADTRTGRERQIWNPNPQLLHLQMGEASVYQWKDRAGREWTAGLIKPVGYIQGKRYPLVIQMYEFDEKQFLTDGTDPTAFAARELASAGFVVLQIRKKIVNLSDEDAQIHLEAYRSAIEHLSEAGLIDPNKVGVVGFSWTCWYVVNALVKSPRLFAAATIAEGFDNSYMQYMLFGPGSPNTREQMNQLRGGSPFGPGLQHWVRDAPGFHLDRVQTPLRIEAMKPATILNEWEIYSGLYMQHKPVDMIYFPSGTHIHQRPLERLESQQGNIDWMRFWLQGYEDPAPEKRAQYARWQKLKLAVKEKGSAAVAP